MIRDMDIRGSYITTSVFKEKAIFGWSPHASRKLGYTLHACIAKPNTYMHMLMYILA